MKHILLSIRPKYVDSILCGTKTIELRKKFPYLPEDLIEVYIYCTKGNGRDYLTNVSELSELTKNTPGFEDQPMYVYATDGLFGSWGEDILNGQIVAKFMLQGAEIIPYPYIPGLKLKDGSNEPNFDKVMIPQLHLKRTCLSQKEVDEYAQGSNLIGIPIKDLTIFEPEERPTLESFGLKQAPINYCYIKEEEEE